MGAAKDRRAALAAGDMTADVEQLCDLGEACIDSDNCCSALGEQIVAKAAAAVHLDEQAAEIVQGVVARLQEGTTLAAQHARLGAARSDSFRVTGAPAKERCHRGRV